MEARNDLVLSFWTITLNGWRIVEVRSLLAQSRKDLYGNATIGENIVMIESKNNIVHTLNEKKVVIQGLEGYIVAEEDGTLLICKLSEEQRIKQFSGSEK